jgi:hypothetical protein
LCVRLLPHGCMPGMLPKFRQRLPWGNSHNLPRTQSAFRYFLSRALQRADRPPPTTLPGSWRWDAALESVSTCSRPLWAVSHTYLGSTPARITARHRSSTTSLSAETAFRLHNQQPHLLAKPLDQRLS